MLNLNARSRWNNYRQQFQKQNHLHEKCKSRFVSSKVVAHQCLSKNMPMFSMLAVIIIVAVQALNQAMLQTIAMGGIVVVIAVTIVIVVHLLAAIQAVIVAVVVVVVEAADLDRVIIIVIIVVLHAVVVLRPVIRLFQRNVAVQQVYAMKLQVQSFQPNVSAQ